MTDKRTPPSYEDGGRSAMILAISSLALAVMEMRNSVDLSEASKNVINSQMDDVLRALRTLSGRDNESEEAEGDG